MNNINVHLNLNSSVASNVTFTVKSPDSIVGRQPRGYWLISIEQVRGGVPIGCIDLFMTETQFMELQSEMLKQWQAAP